MKTTPFVTAAVCLASTVIASPVQRKSLFGGGKDGNFISNIFDSAACVVGSVIGGTDSNCHGKGNSAVRPPNVGDGSEKLNTHYTYTYDSNTDGSLKVTITLDRGGSCTYNLRSDGKKIKSIIDDAATKCFADRS
ncbi:hypothetical protein BGZ63DRAFT_406227 [Mariannaea sp. PMI_226]|nr:hypothetical protein BGZ63DRAFT_406227 [Mariannaea sp. PMI_226]